MIAFVSSRTSNSWTSDFVCQFKVAKWPFVLARRRSLPVGEYFIRYLPGRECRENRLLAVMMSASRTKSLKIN